MFTAILPNLSVMARVNGPELGFRVETLAKQERLPPPPLKVVDTFRSFETLSNNKDIKTRVEFFGACLQDERDPFTGLKAPDYEMKDTNLRKGSIAV